jgi:hypothetical protein
MPGRPQKKEISRKNLAGPFRQNERNTGNRRGGFLKNREEIERQYTEKKPLPGRLAR